MNRELATPSIATRCMFAVGAAVITMSIGGFIDYLANDYATALHTIVQAPAPKAVALASAVD